MFLSLRYHETAQRPASAAFLRGADPAAWLRELSRWHLPAAQLTCYLVPESIRSVRVAGLFVVAAGPLPADVLEPYGSAADGRLYVPVGATLWPATAPGELAGALLWPRQLLHPGIGLVGFDAGDELDLTTLLDCPVPRATDWGRARPGLAPRPRLQQVRVLQPTVEEVVQSIQEEVGSVPLAQLPGLADDRTGPLQTAFDNLRRRLLKAVLAVVRGWPGLPKWPSGNFMGALGAIVLLMMVVALLASVFAQLGQGSGAGFIVPLTFLAIRIWRSFSEKDARRPARPAAPGRVGKPGPFQRLERWLGGRIYNLEQKRQNEIERLLKLFGENLEEALKYAIPLGGPYQDRGRAPESARLGPRSTDFNLGGLGGGGRVDAWNLDAYRGSLSQQYRAAATQEIKAGRFKKAAYIYAHLLGDYLAAANTLAQGGCYREAAALYKDHLHNKPAAAKCLESGGLLLEAAELYAELQEHEKAGDLHQRLDQPALAARHYERGVALLLGNHDHPAAARLLAHKLADTGRAQEVLLQGWAGPKQPEVCLRQYFELLATAPDTDLSASVRAVFAGHTPREQRVPLLRVLATLSEKHPAPALLSTSRDIAYDVVSAEAAAGNLAHLSLLRHFVPDDQLIAADCGRFISQPRTSAAARPPAGPTAPPLDPTIRWKVARTYRHQWVAVGLRDERLHLARGNWYGQVEYYSWMTPVPASTAVELVVDEQHGPRVILRPSAQLSLETRLLPKNKYFAEALTVECPTWLPPWPTRVCLLPDGGTATARLQDADIVVQRYSPEGQALASFTYAFVEGNPDEHATGRNWPNDLLYRNGVYYSCWHNWAVCWSEDGQGQAHQLPAEALQLVPSPYTQVLQLVIALPEDLFIWEPTWPISKEPLPAFTAGFELSGDLQFVGPDHVVVRDDSGATLLRWTKNEYELVRAIELKSDPVAVLATSNRQQFAMLEESGCFTLHSLDDN